MADARSPLEGSAAAPDERLPWQMPDGEAPPASATTWEETRARPALQELKGRLHRQLLERLNFSNLEALDKLQVISAIRKALHELLAEDSTPLNFEEREELISQVLDEIFGLGPLEPLLKDADISDVLVNTFSDVWIERHGLLEKTDVRFQNEKHL